MIRYISSEWKTKKEIIADAKANGCKINERELRKFIERYNKQYWAHQVEKFIVHSRKGYKLTSDKDEINASIQDSKKRALNLLWKYSQTRRALGEVDNIKLDLEKLEII